MMEEILKIFFELPFVPRVAICLISLIIVWAIIGKFIFWILSVIPFTLSRLFVLCFRILEIPITVLHKKYGTVFYKIDDRINDIGDKGYNILNGWYQSWHFKYKFKLGRTFLVFLICFIVIVVPYFVSFQSEVLNLGKNLYFLCELLIQEDDMILKDLEVN